MLCQRNAVGVNLLLNQLDQPTKANRQHFAGLSLDDTIRVMRTGRVPADYDYTQSFVCSICSSQLRRPVSMMCGHAACRTCAARSAFFHEKCPKCTVTVSLPGGYAPDQVMRVVEKQRLATVRVSDAERTLDELLAVMSSIVGHQSFTRESPVMVVELSTGIRLQLQLGFSPFGEHPWALRVWFIADCPRTNKTELAGIHSLAAHQAAEMPQLASIRTVVSFAPSPQRLVIESIFSQTTSTPDSVRLHFHALYSWSVSIADLTKLCNSE